MFIYFCVNFFSFKHLTSVMNFLLNVLSYIYNLFLFTHFHYRIRNSNSWIFFLLYLRSYIFFILLFISSPLVILTFIPLLFCYFIFRLSNFSGHFTYLEIGLTGSFFSRFRLMVIILTFSPVVISVMVVIFLLSPYIKFLNKSLYIIESTFCV